MNKKVTLAFPTHIGHFRPPDAAAVNRELRRVILDKERAEPSTDYSNVGG